MVLGSETSSQSTPKVTVETTRKNHAAVFGTSVGVRMPTIMFWEIPLGVDMHNLPYLAVPLSIVSVATKNAAIYTRLSKLTAV